MPRITVDFSDVQDFEVLPTGEYSGVITKTTLRNVDVEDKFPYINVEIDIQEALETKEDAGDVEGRKVWMVMSTSPKALGITKQYLENLDLYVENLDIDAEEGDNGDLIVTNPEMVGLPVKVQLSKRKYEGREQNQVEGIWSLNGSGGSSPKKSGGGPKKSGPAKAGGKKAFK